MKNNVYVLLKSLNKDVSVCKVSTDRLALKRLKRTLIKEQTAIWEFKALIQARKKRYAIEWNRSNEISFTLDEITSREANMWAWVDKQMLPYIIELAIPDSIMDKCVSSNEHFIYTYIIQESELI